VSDNHLYGSLGYNECLRRQQEAIEAAPYEGQAGLDRIAEKAALDATVVSVVPAGAARHKEIEDGR
jgi:hypothetical protein